MTGAEHQRHDDCYRSGHGRPERWHQIQQPGQHPEDDRPGQANGQSADGRQRAHNCYQQQLAAKKCIAGAVDFL